MESLMNRLYNATFVRTSVRRYNGSPDKETFYELKDFANKISNDEARLVLLSKGEILRAPLFMPSITGTKCCAAVITKKDSKYMGGYLGEVFVLECAARGIGTCWLGGSYKKSAARSYLNLNADEKLACVIAFGICEADMKAKLKGKKSPEELAAMSHNEYLNLPKWQQKALECVCYAPSAMNKQAWEFDFKGENIYLYSTSDNMGFSEIDCGIAMLHVELGAAQGRIIGEWSFDDESPRFTPI